MEDAHLPLLDRLEERARREGRFDEESRGARRDAREQAGEAERVRNRHHERTPVVLGKVEDRRQLARCATLANVTDERTLWRPRRPGRVEQPADLRPEGLGVTISASRNLGFDLAEEAEKEGASHRR